MLEAEQKETSGVLSTSRIPAIDFVRGLVIILMALDHASTYWNSGRVFGEFWYDFDMGFTANVGLLQFLVRFISHWCAPTFIFLAGTSIALSEARRLEKGDTQASITEHLIIRGGVLLVIEWTIIAWLFSAAPLYFGVLAMIGVGIIIFAFARHLKSSIIIAFCLLMLLFPIIIQLITGSHPINSSIFFISVIPVKDFPLWLRVALRQPQFPYGLYPLDPWLAVMALGFVFGRWLLKQQNLPDGNSRVVKRLAAAGTISIAAFFPLRIIQGIPLSYLTIQTGDFTYRSDAFTIETFFTMSKYPPSPMFLLWTLGGMCLVLALAFHFQNLEWFNKWAGPAVLIGSTALFFYSIHLFVYGGIPILLDLVKAFSLEITLLVWILGLLILYPACAGFQKLKKKYPNSPLKYI